MTLYEKLYAGLTNIQMLSLEEHTTNKKGLTEILNQVYELKSVLFGNLFT